MPFVDREVAMVRKRYVVLATWDDEAKVWVATSEDVPGLATEATTLEKLVSKLKVMIPELLEANGVDDGGDIPFTLCSELVAAGHAHA